MSGLLVALSSAILVLVGCGSESSVTDSGSPEPDTSSLDDVHCWNHALNGDGQESSLVESWDCDGHVYRMSCHPSGNATSIDINSNGQTYRCNKGLIYCTCNRDDDFVNGFERFYQPEAGVSWGSFRNGCCPPEACGSKTYIFQPTLGYCKKIS